MKANNLIIAIILLIAGFAIIFFSIVPKYLEYSDLSASLSETQSQYINKLDYYKKLTDVISKIKSNEDFINKMNSALPETDSTANIISFLQSESDKYNLKIQSISFSKTSQPTNTDIKNINFTLDLYGQYYDFKKFLDSVDKSSRLFEVYNISFESQTPSDGVPYSSQSDKYFKMDILTHSY
ncbi:MAG: hypothetical protein A3D35_03005 [Candidatus Staskawiczbacteria bacterium RIFCSPHIGHO2_02_FULL_34_9]|uniref:Type 4a pilus biogenesis protein PilO n=1 Tax=Candidatus Staskawiczbacteria bacterium RIFCSPHIGHO2_02_FULL_34_9 TaxID=1802206 RepID=A0A1G2I540_9BACT|nr:MAG: hypothetical protein A3D35_03005 [Candidatus Staskawiczbacteria bacterium RIFCSPHIGHO2_02_FULL_34_9]